MPKLIKVYLKNMFLFFLNVRLYIFNTTDMQTEVPWIIPFGSHHISEYKQFNSNSVWKLLVPFTYFNSASV